MKRQKLWLSWLLSLCMVGTCAVAVACNNGGNSNEDSIGGSVSDSPSGDTTPSDTGNGNVGGDVIPDVSIETTADSTGGSSGGDVDDPTPDVKPKEKTYSVTVLAENGRPMNETTVCFTDNSGAVEKFSTDADGEVLAVLEEKEYDVTLEGLSLGYVANQDGYRFASGESSLEIVLGIQLVDKADRVGHIYKVGDVMHDFSIPTLDGETLTLSELLEEKDMVFLNFWFMTCHPCLTEMPWMNNAYNDNRYAGKLEMIAIHADFYGVDEVKEELSARDWNFKFSHDDLTDIANYFGVDAFPTTVIIDSYGMVSFLEVGRFANQAECYQVIESHLTGHFHDVQIWSTVDVPTLEEEGLLKGQCADCGETLSVVLPVLNCSDYSFESATCLTEEKYNIYVDNFGNISSDVGGGMMLSFVGQEGAGSHIVVKNGVVYEMNQEFYPMNGENSYAGIIKEFVDQQATCAQDSQGYFVCDVCQKNILVRTYREHESCYTLTRINETEFTLARECLNDCGEVGSEIVTLRTEENPEGRVIYTRKGHGYCSDPICDYYAVYDEDGFVLADLKENVEEVPHSVIIDDKIYIMDKEMYPMNGRDSYESVITEFEDRKSTCTQNGDGFFKCVECCKNIKVITYREHYLRYTLARINETEFTLAWECLNDCGGVGAEIVTLRTEENPEGRVIYTREGDGICCDPICDYYAVYDEDGRLLAGLEENVEEVPHSVIIDGKSCFMDQEMYPLDGEDSYAEVITELLGAEASYGQPGVGIFRCVVCAELFAVDTYREHEHKREYNTLTKVSETEFDFWWVCEKGGESGSTRLLLKTEEHPGGAVKYDGERYTVSYYGEVYVFSAEEVE